MRRRGTLSGVRRVIAGIFVGGAGTRMGGVPKGLLRVASGETIVERWCALLGPRAAGTVLVGEHPAYSALGVPMLRDAPVGAGPIGGVIALLEHARSQGAAYALALGGDMPWVSGALVDRLIAASPAPIVAPRRDGRWETFFARYAVSGAVLATARRRAGDGEHSLQSLFRASGAVELRLDAREACELRDWDTPADLAIGQP